MECYRCDVCAKSFTGLVCFQQHEASEKHKKKMRLLNGATSEMPKIINSDQFHCPACLVSISGFDNYQKHAISLEHALNVQKKNGDLLSQSLSSPLELKTEQNEPMQTRISLTSPMKVVAPFAECKPCKKQFSGPEPYQQHLASAAHKKKCGYSNEIVQSSQTDFSVGNNFNNNTLHDAESEADPNKMALEQFSDQSVSDTFELKTEQNQLRESLSALTGPMKVIAPFAECKPCQKQFTGPEPYQQHLASAGHKKKCAPYETKQSMETDSSVCNEKANNNSLNDSQSSIFQGVQNEMTPQPFAKCDICNMEFNENLSYQMHLVTDSHEKKASDQLLVKQLNAYKCDICVMTFSGPVPYQQHLVSNGHKKKTNATDLSTQFATQGSLPPPDSTSRGNYLDFEQSSMNNIRSWYCDVCKKQCSGPIPYNSHITSRDHSKNLRIREVEENLKKLKESGPIACLENNEIDSNLISQVTSTADLHAEFRNEMKGSSVEFKINDLNINVKGENTKTLSDKFQLSANDLIALPNLNIIPPEKLDISVFGPEDEILFSSPKKCKQEFLSEMNEEKMGDIKNINETNCLMVE